MQEPHLPPSPSYGPRRYHLGITAAARRRRTPLVAERTLQQVQSHFIIQEQPHCPKVAHLSTSQTISQMASGSETIPVTDYISAVCSAIAAVIALVTVVTVIVAVQQLLTEHRAFATGLSREALGDWHENVRTKRLLGLVRLLFFPTKYYTPPS